VDQRLGRIFSFFIQASSLRKEAVGSSKKLVTSYKTGYMAFKQRDRNPYTIRNILKPTVLS
jgi:hypothetical protein